MEGMLGFFLMISVISASGALAPGPLLIATMNLSLKAGRYAGFLAALGHMAFELPLVLLIGLGVWSFMADPAVRLAIGVVGGAALMAFGLIQARSSIKAIGSEADSVGGDPLGRLTLGRRGFSAAFLVGFLFTALNPYFLMWWFTVGLILISEAIKLGALAGILLMFAFHIWVDYAWLGAAGYAVAVGARFLKPRQISILSLILALTIIVLGAMFIRSAVTGSL
ncbi:MAG TPA: hypothetical protein ENG52_02200 [Nitrososphaeria archaeon]|nr:hypothetical protein [Nitrososphaeria archaeon]